MKKIVLTSCGIICEDLKQHFYKLLNKDIAKVKVLFVKIASDGELDPDKNWIDEEYQSILDLGIRAENIIEYSFGMKLEEFDVIYMLGGNTFYLMKELRGHSIDKEIKEAIENGVVYVGSSAGSVIMGKSIETSLPYDENRVKLEDFSGLNYIDGNVIPHSNRKQENIKQLKQNNVDIMELYDNYGIVIEEDKIYNYNHINLDLFDNLPDSIKRIILNKDFKENDIGKTDSKVYMFDDMVLKIQKENEEDRNQNNITKIIKNYIPIPKIIDYVKENGMSYTLMSKIEGKMLCSEEILKNPKLLIKLLAEGLEKLWSVDITKCNISSVSNINKRLEMAKYNIKNNLVDVNNIMPETFGKNGFESPMALLNWLENNVPDKDLVFTHGDYCLENIFYKNEHISGFIDIGKSGIADRWQDLAICIRELDSVFSNEYIKDFDYSRYSSDMLLTELGIERDNIKLKYYMLLDELF